MAAKAKTAKGKGAKGRAYGPATVLKPVLVGGLVLVVVNVVLGAVLGG